METKHTPGEWVTESKELNIITVHNGEINIADVLEIDIDPEEAEANARLIACAPMLLETLEGVMKALSRMIDKHDPDSIEAEWIGNAHEAILKATQP